MSTDLKSRADELIHQFSCVVSDAAVDQLRGSDYAEKVQPPADALTRFVHALCEAADRLREYRKHECIEAQHGETGRIWSGPRYKMPDRYIEISNESGESDEEFSAALAALEKGEKA